MHSSAPVRLQVGARFRNPRSRQVSLELRERSEAAGVYPQADNLADSARSADLPNPHFSHWIGTAGKMGRRGDSRLFF